MARRKARKNFFWSSKPKVTFPTFIILIGRDEEHYVTGQRQWDKIKAELGSTKLNKLKLAGTQYGTPVFRDDISGGESLAAWLGGHAVQNPSRLKFRVTQKASKGKRKRVEIVELLSQPTRRSRKNPHVKGAPGKYWYVFGVREWDQDGDEDYFRLTVKGDTLYEAEQRARAVWDDPANGSEVEWIRKARNTDEVKKLRANPARKNPTTGLKAPYANWTSDPQYAYDQFYRANPRRNPSAFSAKKVPWEVATNAGAFTPGMFPYGQGGKPYAYKNPRRARKNPDATWIASRMTSAGEHLKGFLSKKNAEKWAGKDGEVFRGPLDLGSDYLRAGSDVYMPFEEDEAPMWAARNNRGRRSRKNRGSLAVPSKLKKTPRSRAEGVYVFPPRRGEKGRYPIGDLYHARMAVIWSTTWPNQQKSKPAVLRAVKAHYPQYDWGAFAAKLVREQKARKNRSRRRR